MGTWITFLSLFVFSSASIQGLTDENCPLEKVALAESRAASQRSTPSLSAIAPSVEVTNKIEANSEQRQPFYIGASPRAMMHGEKAAEITLSSATKDLANKQASILLNRLRLEAVEFEIWPALNDEGDRTWVYARWRRNDKEEWHWLNQSQWPQYLNDGSPPPILPRRLNPSNPKDAKTLFQDMLDFPSLYRKPLFGDAVWTTDRGKTVVDAWLPLDQRLMYPQKISESSNVYARVLPQPAQFNDEPISFILKSTKLGHQWPENIHWESESKLHPTVPNNPTSALRSHSFSPDFDTEFSNDIEVLSGKREALFPLSGRKVTFTRKNSAQKDHQLELLADYLTERYQKLGLEVRKQHFEWRGLPQTNLIVVIPGEDRSLPPLIMADHYDTAFEEDTFAATGKRVSNPGADDNGTATASLLRAGAELKNTKPKRDIWLVHLTGEEFPADDLGVRHLMQQLLKEKKDIAGMVLIDMIGIRNPKDPIFQINGGQTKASLDLSGIAMAAAAKEATGLQARFRPRYSDESYLYNTDGYIVDSLGFPVVYFNEHLNRKTMDKINIHYHKTTDLPENIDWEYASKISKTAILTVLNAASN